VSRSAAFLVGIVAFVAFAGLYALSWIAAFAFLALWLAATVLYRRRHRRWGEGVVVEAAPAQSWRRSRGRCRCHAKPSH